MKRPELVVYFIDGLDHGFVTRSLHHSERFAELFAPENIHRVGGTVHSLLCMSHIFCGRHNEVLHFEAWEQIPTSDRIINWDMLLSHCHEDELIWRRLNAMGHRVGLMEMLGVFLSPELDGFSVTKHLVPLGIQQVYDQMLCHHPPGIGDLYQELKQANGYPQKIDEDLHDAREVVDGPLCELSDSDIWWVMKACGYHDLFEVVDRSIRDGFRVTRGLLEQHPADVLFIHMGHFDRLGHFFHGWGAEEREMMFLLDRVMSDMEELLEPKEVLVFSDHGMALGTPHWSDHHLNRAHHDESRALVTGSGPRVEAAMAAAPPTDLASVYDLILHTLDPGAATGLDRPPLSWEQKVRQLEQVVIQRDQLLVQLCKGEMNE